MGLLVVLGAHPDWIDIPHLAQKLKHLLDYKFDIDVYRYYGNLDVNLLNKGTVKNQRVDRDFIAVRTTDKTDDVFEALGAALLDSSKTARTIVHGLKIMPMRPQAEFEEAAPVLEIYQHNLAITKLTRVKIQQLCL